MFLLGISAVFLYLFSSHLLLSGLHTLCHRSPDIAIMQAECVSSLHRTQSAHIVVLAALMAIVASQRDDSVHHVTPVVDEPGDGVWVPAVTEGNGQIFGGESVLLCFLNIKIQGYYLTLLPF